MTEAAVSQEPLHQDLVWQRVDELVDLVGIFDANVQISAFPRRLDDSLKEYLSQLNGEGELQLIETVSRTDELELERLPEGPGKSALIEDLSLLRDIVCDLVDCDAVGLRVARVSQAMCPGWHIDRVGIRMVCTYQGPGTQWLEDQSVDRSLLSQIKKRRPSLYRSR